MRRNRNSRASELRGRRIVPVCAILLVMCCGVYSLSSEAKDGPFRKWWANIPEAPMQVALSANKRFLFLENASSKKISAFKVGCVVRLGDALSNVQPLVMKEFELEPKKSLIWDMRDPDIALTKCKQKGSRVAITEVQFVDGSHWKLDGCTRDASLRCRIHVPSFRFPTKAKAQGLMGCSLL